MTPKRIGKYRILKFIGKGSFASVYKAQDDNNDIFALKLFDESYVEELPRVRREFRALLKLGHPSIVKVKEWGIHESRPFFVMDFLEGRDFKDRFEKFRRKGASALTEFFALLAQLLADVADSLNYIHSRRIVHRDIKPSNIMALKKDDAIRLMDFGLIAAAPSAGFAAQTNVIAGSPAYMAPEQLEERPLDRRCDLYSLGITLFEAVTGRLPFHDESLHSVIRSHLTGDLIALSDVMGSEWNEWNDICTKLTARNPQGRFQSAAELAEEIHKRFGKITQVPVRREALELSLLQAPYIDNDNLISRMKEKLVNLKSSKGGAIWLKGASGSGKTRILKELETMAFDATVNVIKVDALISRDSPLSLLQALLEKMEFSFKELLSEESELKRTFDFLKGRSSMIPDMDDAGNITEKYSLFDSFKELLFHLIKIKPLLIILDNLHLSHALFREMIKNAAERLIYTRREGGKYLPSDIAFLIVSSYNQEKSPAALKKNVEIMMKNNDAEVIELKAFDINATERLIKHVMGIRNALPGLSRFIYERSRGIPKKALRILRNLIAMRIIQKKGNEWRWRSSRGEFSLESLDQSAAEADMPEREEMEIYALQGLLSSEARWALRGFAVWGAGIPLSALKSISGLNENKLYDALNELWDNDYIDYAGSSSSLLTLSDAAVSDRIIADMDPVIKRNLHRKAAETLIAETHFNTAASADQKARHYRNAGMPRKALPFFIKAAENRLKQFSHEEALKFYQEALEINDNALLQKKIEPAASSGILLTAETPPLNLIRTRFSEKILQKKNQKKLNIRRRILKNTGSIYFQLGEYDSAERQWKNALQIAEQTQNYDETALLTQKLGEMYYRQKKTNQAAEAFQKAAQIHRNAENLAGEARSFNGLGAVYQTLGKQNEALKAYHDAQRMFAMAENSRGEAFSINNIGNIYFYSQQTDKAKNLFQKAADIMESSDDLHGAAYVLNNLGGAQMNAGDYRQARNTFIKALKIRKKIGDRRGQIAVLRNLGKLNLILGNIQLALDRFREAFNTTLYLGKSFLNPSIISGMSDCLIQFGDTQQVESLLQQHSNILKPQEKNTEDFMKIRLLLLMEQQNIEQAEIIMKNMVDLFLKKNMTARAALMNIHRSRLLIDMKKFHEAEKILLENKKAFDSNKYPLHDQLKFLFSLGKLYRKTNRIQKALPVLNHALTQAENKNLAALQSDISMELFRLAADRKNWKDALLLLQKTIKLMDSAVENIKKSKHKKGYIKRMIDQDDLRLIKLTSLKNKLPVPPLFQALISD